MTAPTENECIDYVRTLENDYSLFREQAQHDADLYTLRLLPRIAKALAREQAVYILSQDLSNEAEAVSAFMLAMQTSLTVAPSARDHTTGTIKAADQKLADELERGLALAWLKLNSNRVLENSLIFRMMVQPVGAIVLEMGAIESLDPDDNWPYKAYEIEIDGLGWQEVGGIPTIAGRHYKQLQMEVEREFSGRRQNGTAHEGGILTKKNGSWDFVPASDDYSPRLPPIEAGGGRSKLPEADIMTLYSPEWISIVALNDAPRKIGPVTLGKQTGKLIWQAPNPFGRVPVFLASGIQTPLREMTEKRAAFLRDLGTVTEQINWVESTRATGARNRAAARNYAKPDPESLKAYMEANQGHLPPDIVWKDGETPYIMAELLEVPGGVDPDLDKLEAALEARRQRYSVAAFTQLLDPQIVKDSTLGAWAGAFDASAQKVSKPAGYKDMLIRDILKALEHSIKYVADKHGDVYAQYGLTGGASYLKTSSGKVKEGSAALLNKAAVDFPHEIVVASRSNTLAQRMQLIQIARGGFDPLGDGRPGPGIWQDLWDAMDEDDPTARTSTMAEESLIAEFGAPYVNQQVLASTDYQIELETGERLPLANQGVDPSMTDPNAAAPPAPTAAGPSVPPAGPGMGQPQPMTPTEPVVSSGPPPMGP